MLRKASIEELRKGEVSRALGHIAVVMCRYPRGISKKLIDEYIKALAPDKKLLDDFHAAREELGSHNAAFGAVKYEQRFSLDETGIAELKRLAELSAQKDVFLLCQCKQDQRCHRELLVLLAKRWFGAKGDLRRFSYPEFEQRIPDAPGPF